MLPAQQDFFETAAKRWPKRVAVDDHGVVTTYEELDARANRIGNLVRSLGGGPNARVCLLMSKTADMYAAVLGSLKAGCCWVPLSQAFPEERIKSILQNLSACVVIVDVANVARILAARAELNLGFDTVLLGADASEDSLVFGEASVAASSDLCPERSNFSPDDLAYIIFTSGSTGVPKGVMALHRNTTQFLSVCQDFFQISEGLRFAHFSDLTFDPSIFDLFYCWSTGGTLVPFNRRKYRINPSLFLREQNINVLFTVPSVIATIRDGGSLDDRALDVVQHLLLTGEALPARVISEWCRAHPRCAVYNMYGTTETAIVSHWHRFECGKDIPEPVPVGRPVPGVRVLLCNGDRVVAKGDIGESVVYGSQISPGYWSNSFQTEASFVQNPIEPTLPQLVYRTGDLLKEGDDGLHYFVGRRDRQVKVRGHRVELGEVENVILQHVNVKEAIAVVVGSEEATYERRIIALVTLFEDQDISEIQRHAGERLPNYMAPYKVIWMTELPRNNNGKVDRVAAAEFAARSV